MSEIIFGKFYDPFAETALLTDSELRRRIEQTRAEAHRSGNDHAWSRLAKLQTAASIRKARAERGILAA